MVPCPFQQPVESIAQFGGINARRRQFTQRQGLSFGAYRIPEASNCFSWPFESFLQIVFVTKGRVSVGLPDEGSTSAIQGEWFVISLGAWAGTTSFECESQIGVIECSKEVWQGLVNEEDTLLHARKACYSCSQREEAILTKGIQDARMRNLSEGLLNNIGASPSDRLLVESMTLEFLARVCDSKFISGSSKSEPCYRSRDEEALAEAASYLEGNLDENHSLAGLSRKFALNEFKLKRGFRERFGITVFGYLRQCRMDRARQLLLSRRYTVLEVANAVGYANPSHFARAFRGCFGLNPKAFLADSARQS